MTLPAPRTTTPSAINRHVRQLIDKLVHNGRAQYVEVSPEPDAQINECFPNVATKIARDGGRMLCGWQVWEWPHVMVEAEFHAVWRSPEGGMTDITPKSQGEKRILFVSDPRRAYEGTVVDNVRHAIRDDLLVHHLIKVSEAITRVMNRGARATEYGYVSVPEHEIGPLVTARDLIGTSLILGRRDHDPCMCGSGSKYKRCHGRTWELALQSSGERSPIFR